MLSNNKLILSWIAISLGGPAFAGDDESADSGSIPIATIERQEPVDFAKEIFPILKANCIACHNASKAKGKLNLENPKAILKGGSEGPAVVPGNAEDSLLLILAAYQDDPVMPPEGNKSNAVPLTPEELGFLKLWIDQGAKGEAAAFVEAPEIWFPAKGINQPAYNMAIAPDGQSAVVGRGNQVHLYDLARKTFVEKLEDTELLQQKNFESAQAAHLDLVQSLAVSSDGRIASGGFREVKVWSRPDQSLRQKIPALPEVVTALASSVDGSSLVAGDKSGNLRHWMTVKPEEKRESKVHDGAVTGVAMISGDRTVSVSADATIRVRLTSDQADEVRVTTPSAISALAKVGEELLATAHADNVVRVWTVPDVESAEPVKELKGHGKAVTSLASVPSNMALLVSGADDGSAKLWDINEAREIRSFDHGEPVQGVAVSADGKHLVTAGGAILRVWNLENGEKLREIKGGQLALSNLTAAERGLAAAKLLSGERKQRLDQAAKRLKEEGDKSKGAAEAFAKSQAELQRKRAARDSASVTLKATEISGNGDEKKKANDAYNKSVGEVASAEEVANRARQNAELGVRLTARAAEANIQAESDFAAAEAAQREAEATLEAAKKAVTAAEKPWSRLAFSADGTQIYAGSESGEIVIWALDGTSLGTFVGNRSAVTALHLMANGDLVSAGMNKTLLHWNGQRNWSVERRLGDGKDHKQFVDRVTALAFDPTGRFLATGGGSPSRSGELKLWNTEDGSLIFQNDEAHSDTIVGIEFSPDGRHIACASTDRFVRVFDAGTGEEIAAFEGHTGHVLDIAWRADGLVLASAGADSVVKLWDFEGRKQIKTEQGFGKEVTSVDFLGATGSFLASSGDKSVRINQERLGGPASYVHRSKSDASGRLIVASDQDSILRVWNSADKKLVMTFGAVE